MHFSLLTSQLCFRERETEWIVYKSVGSIFKQRDIFVQMTNKYKNNCCERLYSAFEIQSLKNCVSKIWYRCKACQKTA